jgi:SOS-response transcriptional repressor LexA
VVASDAEEEGFFALSDGSAGIRIKGDSMDPLARQGQIAVIAPIGRSARSRDLVVVTLKNDKGIFFKRYFESGRAKGGSNVISLVSINPVVPIPPIIIEEGEIADIRVVTGIMFEADEHRERTEIDG